MNKNVSVRFGLALAMTSLIGAGCASYNSQAKVMVGRWNAGDFRGAATEASKAASKQKTETDCDAVVWRLEQGATLRAAGQYKESIAAFDTAEEGANVFDGKAAGKKAAEETVALLTNPSMLPYEGYAYDKIMLNTYKAADYLQLGDFQNARVEFNRALEKQQDAMAVNAKRIEKAQDAAKKKKQNVDTEKIQSDPKFSEEWKKNYLDLDEMKFYADYRNPFTEYLSGLFFMCQPSGGSDLQRARKSFELVLGMAGENRFIDQDMKMIEQATAGQPISPTTYVFFETGRAPSREQITIPIPLFIVTKKVPYMQVAFPKLKFHDGHAGGLTVKMCDTNETTVMLSSMDRVIGQEFKNDMTRVIIRTVASAAVKAGISYGISEGTKNNSTAEIAAQAAWAIFQVIENQADMRTWNTLPKEIHFCRFPTPADRKIELAENNCSSKTQVTLDDGIVNLVWVRSVTNAAPLQVSQCKLK